MNPRRTALAAVAALFLATSAFAVSNTVVIQEFRTRGPNGGNDEFVEIKNISAAPIAIGGWKLNGSNSAGTIGTRATVPAGVNLGAGCSYLFTNSASGGYSGSVAGNQTYTTGITDDGGVAILNTSNVIIDAAGMSAGSAYKEGTILGQLTTNVNRSYERTTDTDNNATDFALVNPSTPQSGCAATPTNPSGTGSASPNAVLPGGTSLLTVTVTPGANPTSTGVAVAVNLSSIGGSSTQAFFDNATNGDVTANDNIFSFSATVTAATAPGAKTLAATITDGQARTGAASIALTVQAPSTNPTGSGSASPSSVARGASTTLTVNVTPGTGPASTGITVTGDLSSIGGSSTTAFSGSGNTFTFNATIPFATTLGTKTLPITVADAQSRSSNTSISLTVVAPTIAPGSVVISQIYGAGGNSGATLKNDYIELFNRTSSPIDLEGWSAQYFSSSQNQWFVHELHGTIAPYSYFLLKEAQGTDGTVDLPAADSTGTLAMGAGAGRVALATVTTQLTGCPTGATIMDLVGYGSNSCSEAPPVGTLSVTTAAIRGLGGCRDNNDNGFDFAIGTPAPRNSATAPNNCAFAVDPPIAPHVVISQVYTAGGNSGASYRNDFVEIYNPTSSAVNLNDWSIQYASATGSAWSSQTQPIGGTIAPGEYYLIQLASGGANGTPLASPRIIGDINMSATAGKIALVNKSEGLTGNCPFNDLALVDLVGWGTTADCFEGGSPAEDPSSNTIVMVRKNNGDTDTNQNLADFTSNTTGDAVRGGGALIDLRPRITGWNPRVDAPRDLSISLDMSEAVTVPAGGGWFDIQCSSTGSHNNAEVASAFGGNAYVITPNITFQPGETCTVRIIASSVLDQDGTPDTMPADLVWSFNVATGPSVESAEIHLAMGNPSNATLADPNNYLLSKPEMAISYNRDKGTPNWTSWHLSDDWKGSTPRIDEFRPDPQLPSTWYRVNQYDYTGSGFNRGHVMPSDDRDGSRPLNQSTFLMTNMMPQAPNQNSGPWGAFEGYLRTQLPTYEIYIVSGPYGVGGTGSNGSATTIAGGKITVPSHTWKVALLLPKASGNDVARVTAATKTIGVIMPNVNNPNSDWNTYKTTVRAVEQLTGYNFFSEVEDAVENAIELGLEGNNPPGAAGQSVNATEDTPKSITVNAVSPNPSATLTYTIVSAPAHGTLSGTAPNYTYTPTANYNGADSFSFKVNDGNATSNTATVAINIAAVNDAPVAQADSASVEAGSTLTFPAATLASNDSTGPLNESTQTLIVNSVTATASTHGTVSLAGGVVTYTPATPFAGAASFSYEVCDDAPDSKCATGIVNVTVRDTTAPAIANMTTSTTQLFPVDHKMVDVTVLYEVSDFGDAAPSCSLAISSNEPINGKGDGKTSNDYQVVDANHVRLRAERSGTSKDGRIYTITALCRDAFLNASQSSVQVLVPHDSSN